jgi:hypothetical protein
VLAEVGGVGAGGVAGLEAEVVAAEEAEENTRVGQIRCVKEGLFSFLIKYVLVPLNYLLEGVVVAAVASKGVGINEATKGVSTLQEG